MKRNHILALILAVLMLLGMTPTFAATDDEFPDSFTSEGCTVSATGTATHFWKLVQVQQATCDEGGSATYRCEYCGETTTLSSQPLGGSHEWSEWDVVEEATCTKDGYRVRGCLRCGAEQRETFTADHQYGGWTVNREPTCTENGLQTRTCSICQHVESFDIPALGHSFGEWEALQSVSLTRGGLWQRRCSRCGFTEMRSEEPLVKREIYALSLSMSPAPTDEDQIPYVDVAVFAEDEPVYKTYEATLINTGLTPLDVGEYTVFPGEKPRTLPFPIHLGVGSSVTLSIPVAYADTQIDKTEAGLHVIGTLKPQFCFYGEAEGKQVCSSNAVSYRYTVTDDVGMSEWRLPGSTDEKSLRLTSFTVSIPWDPSGYTVGDLIRFNYTVTNSSDVQLDNILVYDPLINGDAPIRTISLAPGQSRSLMTQYDVTAEDVVRGYVISRAYAAWNDPANDDALRADSNSVTVSMATEPREGLSFGIGASSPKNDAFFVAGETAELCAELRNQDTVAYENIVVTSPLCSAEGGVFATIDRLEPGGWSGVLDLFYPVTEANSAIGYVMCIANATAQRVEADGSRTPVSLTAYYILDCGIYANSGEQFVTLTREEVSQPKNGVFYTKGETLSYVLTATVTGSATIDCLGLSDSLVSFDVTFQYQLDDQRDLAPGASVSYTAEHTVTAEDVAAGEVESFGFMYFIIEDEARFSSGSYFETAYTQPQTAKTGTAMRPHLPVVISRPGVFAGLPKRNGECLRRIADSSGAYRTYSQEQCASHQAVSDAVDQLLQNAEGQGDEALIRALRDAQQLWSNEMNDLYGEAIEIATIEQTMTLLNERIAWNEYMGRKSALLRSVYAATPVTAEKAITEAWETRCEELCYDLHNPAQPRTDSAYADEADAAGITDSLTLANAFRQAHALRQSDLDRLCDAWYAAADDATGRLVIADRVAFDRFLSAHRNVLEMLYVDQPATVEETLASLLEAKVADTEKLGN